MKFVALYRVSTDRQANEGASLDAQQRRYRELAAVHGWQTVAELRGTESATKAASERQVLQRVLSTICEKSVDAVWVYEQSRLTRGDDLEVALLMRELREREIVVYVQGTRRDLNDPSDGLAFGIVGLVDRAEAARIRERMMRGKHEKARQGKRVVGRAPYGYMNPPPGDPRHGVLQVVEDEAAIVRRIFALAASGAGIERVASLLSGEGIRRPDGERGPWGKTSVRFILHNPVYLGKAVGRAWLRSKADGIRRFDPANPDAIVVENAYAAIVDGETWERAHARDTGRGGKPLVLTGLLWIEGQRVVVRTRRGGVATYRPARHVTGGRGVAAEEALALVWAGFVAQLRRPLALLAMLRVAHDPAATASLDGELAAADRAAAKLRTRRDGLVRALADGDIDRSEFRRQRDQTEGELRAAEERAAGLRRRLEIAGNGSAERHVLAVARMVAAEKLNAAGKRKALLALVERIDATILDRGPQPKDPATGQRYVSRGMPRYGLDEVYLRFRGAEPITSFRTCEQSCLTVQIAKNGRLLEPESTRESGEATGGAA